MKGYCKYGKNACPYTHPGVCHKWKKGECKDQKKCNFIHGDLPVQKSEAHVAAEHKAKAQSSLEAYRKTVPKAKTQIRAKSKSSSSKSSTSSGRKKLKKLQEKKFKKSQKKSSKPKSQLPR